MLGFFPYGVFSLFVASFVLNLMIAPMLFAQTESIVDELDDAVEKLVEQLKVQCQPYFVKGTLPSDARVAIVNVRDQQSGLRRNLSEILEKKLLDEIVSEMDFVIIHPEKTEAVLRPFWKELNQDEHHSVGLRVAETLNASLLISGTFDIQTDELHLNLHLVSVQDEQIYASLQLSLSRTNIPEEWLQLLPFYQNQKHLETAKGFMTMEEWQLAQEELERVSNDASSESIEAKGLLIWMEARQGKSVTKEFIPFKTLHPQHSLITKIEHEQNKQALLRSVNESLQHQEWVQVRQLLQEKGNLMEVPEQTHYEERLEKGALQWIEQTLQQKDWQSLQEQWQILLQVVRSKNALSVTSLQQTITKEFIKEVQGLIDRKNRLGATLLLEQFGSSFIPDNQQTLRQAIATIPIPPDGMMTLPSTTFQMGNRAGYKSEQQVHSVFIEAFHLDQYEVSNQAYRECVEANVCSSGLFDQDVRFNQDNQPVVGVSWEQAQQYCQWKKKRLPTEAEWERAAREVTSSSDYAWFGDNSGGRTRERGTRQVSPSQIFDILGNAMEWVQDYYATDYYAWSPLENPQGPTTGELRVARGGSWYHAAEDTCPSCRFFWSPSLAFEFMGFRCAASLKK